MKRIIIILSLGAFMNVYKKLVLTSPPMWVTRAVRASPNRNMGHPPLPSTALALVLPAPLRPQSLSTGGSARFSPWLRPPCQAWFSRPWGGGVHVLEMGKIKAALSTLASVQTSHIKECLQNNNASTSAIVQVHICINNNPLAQSSYLAPNPLSSLVFHSMGA